MTEFQSELLARINRLIEVIEANTQALYECRLSDDDYDDVQTQQEM